MATKESATANARAESRLAKMRRGKSELRVVVWPGISDAEGQPVAVALRVLSCGEVQECHAEANRRFLDLRLPIDSVHTVSLFEDEVMLQLLVRACRNVERPHDEPFAIDAADMRENTTVDERAAMFSLYRDFASEVDPAPDKMSGAEFDEIIELVKKKAEGTLLGLGSRKLVSFLLTMASRSLT